MDEVLERAQFAYWFWVLHPEASIETSGLVRQLTNGEKVLPRYKNDIQKPIKDLFDGNDELFWRAYKDFMLISLFKKMGAF